ncbi:hypothetical protein ACLB2K_015741 [Fragaria x ananassa]
MDSDFRFAMKSGSKFYHKSTLGPCSTKRFPSLVLITESIREYLCGLAMALANIRMLILSLLLALCGVCFGAIYQVGDSSGWTDKGVDYKIWASYRNFTVGDVLHFKYDRNENNLVRVVHKGFSSCNPEHEIYKLSSGDDYIRLNRPGNFFFICTVNEHCRSGQKIHVSVSQSTVPSVSPGTAPTLSPVPSSSPTQTPVASPTSPTATPAATPEGTPISPPEAAPFVARRTAPFAAPQAAPIAAPKIAPIAAPEAAPISVPKSALAAAPTAAPKDAPTPNTSPSAAPATPPMVEGPPTPSEDFPPDIPLVLNPAPKAAPSNPPKKSSAQSTHSSMPFLMAMVFIVYIVV